MLHGAVVLGHPPPQGHVVDQADQGGGHLRVVGAQQPGVTVLYEVGETRAQPAHDRQADASCLQGGQPEGLEDRGGDVHIGAGQLVQHARRREPSGDSDALPEVHPAGKPLDSLAEWSVTHDGEGDRHSGRGPDVVEDPKQLQGALAVSDPHGAHQSHSPVARARRDRTWRRLDGVRDHMDGGAAWQPAPYLGSGDAADRSPDDRRPAHPGQGRGPGGDWTHPAPQRVHGHDRWHTSA